MKHTHNTQPQIQAFTLVELLVSMTIFGIIMISVLSIFLFSSQMSTRVELNRITQENIKNVMENIAEEVRKDGIDGLGTSCSLGSASGALLESGSMFCTKNSKYTLGTKLSDGSFSVVSDIANNCGFDTANPSSIMNQCYVIKTDRSAGGSYYPLTNSFVSFESLDFIVTNNDTKKLTVSLSVRPSVGKGLAPDIIRGSLIQVQTTVTERFIQTQ